MSQSRRGLCGLKTTQKAGTHGDIGRSAVSLGMGEISQGTGCLELGENSRRDGADPMMMTD